MVTGLIMILMLLTYGGYQHVTVAAKGVENLSNHGFIVRGLLAYASDHNARLPWSNDLANHPNTSSPYNKTLCTLGYISDGRVFFNDKFWKRSSGDKNSALLVITQPEKFANSVRPWAYTTYGVNRYGAMPVSTDGRKPAHLLKVARDGHLSKLILTRDVYQALNDTPTNRSGGGTYWYSGDGFLPPQAETYGGNVHAGFADGHVESIHREKIAEMLKSGAKAPVFHNVYTMD